MTTLTTSPTLGSLVEADVIGTRGTFRVIEGQRAPERGQVWIRETGLGVDLSDPFVIEWAIAELRVVEA